MSSASHAGVKSKAVMPITESVSIAVSPQQAFDDFTRRITDWWPAEYAMVPAPRQVIIEPKKGGRWYEKGADGSERLVATVTAWNPPHEVKFNWHIDAAWQSDPDLATGIDVRFTPAGEATRIDFAHGDLERFGDQAEATRKGLSGPGGWGDILAGFARFTTGSAKGKP